MGNQSETYVCAVLPPKGVTVDFSPRWFTIAPQGTQDLEIKLTVVQVLRTFSFGEVILTGNQNHIVRMPVSVLARSLS